MAKELNDKDLEKVSGGIRPEDIGDPIMLISGYASYKRCPLCGACAFPITTVCKTKKNTTTIPNYECSECGHIIHIRG